MKNWKISHNKYLSDQMNPRLRLAYWEGHRDFAYDLVRFVRPEKIVELGSQYGCSLSAFCQSVLDGGLNTEIHAVDFWSGDIGAENTGEEVFELVQKTVRRYFKSIYVKLYPMDFSEAVEKFEDDSIGILHIDGGHLFEDVDRDFKTWLPKLRQDGIILFHDVYSTIDRGSCDHWDYVKTKYNSWFEFKHSCGLGILFPKGDLWYRRMLDTDFQERCQEIYSYRALYEYTDIRYRELCADYENRYDAVIRQSRMIDERDTEIRALTDLVKEKDEAVEAQKHMIDERDTEIRALTDLVKEKDEAVEAQKHMIDERDTEIRALTDLVKEKDKAVEAQTHMIDERDNTINEQENMIGNLEEVIVENQKWKQIGSRIKIKYR